MIFYIFYVVCKLFLSLKDNFILRHAAKMMKLFV